MFFNSKSFLLYRLNRGQEVKPSYYEKLTKSIMKAHNIATHEVQISSKGMAVARKVVNESSTSELIKAIRPSLGSELRLPSLSQEDANLPIS